MDILQNIFRAIMFFLDNVVYGLIPEIYKVFIFLSELNLYSTDETNPLYQLVSHVYVLLGIFMLFKVSFSLLQYLVDPNAFRDSSKGIGKLVTNVLVALVLLVSVPYIFSAAMELQSTIVQENVIGQLILGRNASDDSDGLSLEKVDVMAKDLQFMLYGTFYRVNTDVIGECAGTSGVFGSKDMATEDCLNALNQFVSSDDNASANGVTLYSFYKHAPAEGTDQGNCVGNVCDDRKFSDFGTLLYGKEDGQYVINYMPFISAAAGIYVVFLLISFTIDIAVRAIKLCFLQMVAPIAIVSYIDPKESIGSGKLNNWIKECASTYFSLFLRLATIFFVMLLIEMISSSILADGNYISGQIHEAGDYSIWIYLFLVIGAFMFAKQVPKMIESIFGIKGSGEFSLNPFKNVGATTLLGGAAGFGLGTVASGVAAAKTSLDNGESGLTTFRRTIGGAASGGLKGGISSVAAGGKGFMSKSFNAAGDVARNTAMKANTKAPYRYGAYVRNAIGAQSLKENLDQRAGVSENFEKSAGNMEARARDQLGKKHDEWKLVQGLRARNEQQFARGNITEEQYKKNLNDYWTREQNMVTQYIDNNGNMGTPALNAEDLDLKKEKESFVRNIKENGLDGMEDLKDKKDMKDAINQQIKKGEDIRWKDIDTIKKAGHNEAVKIKNSDRYEDASNAEKAKLSDLRQSFLNK